MDGSVRSSASHRSARGPSRSVERIAAGAFPEPTTAATRFLGGMPLFQGVGLFSRREKAGACAPTGNPRRRIRADNALGVESRHHHSHDDSESTVRVSGKCGSGEESKLGDVSFLEFPAPALKKRGTRRLKDKV